MNELSVIFESVSNKIGIPNLNSSEFKQTSVLLSLSGGKDSTLALAFYAYLKTKFGIQSIQAFYMDHCIRDTREEIAILLQQTEKFQVPLIIRKSNVPKLSKRLGKSLEETGRIVRYQKLNKILKLSGTKCYVVTGHHSEDYVESVLLHLTRGGGPKSFHTLPPFALKPLPRFLPLVFFSDSELQSARSHLKQELPISVDETNDSEQFKRNRIRKKILPELCLEGLSPYTFYWNSQKETERVFWDWLKEAKTLAIPELSIISRKTWDAATRFQRKQILDLHLEIMQLKPINRGNLLEFERQIETLAETSDRELSDCFLYCQQTGDIWIVSKTSSIWKPLETFEKDNSVCFLWFNQLIKWKITTDSSDYLVRLSEKNDSILVNGKKVQLFEHYRMKKIPSPLRSRLPVLIYKEQVIQHATFNET